MGKYRLVFSFVSILLYPFPPCVFAQTLTLDPAPFIAEPGERESRVQNPPAPVSRPPITSLDLQATMAGPVTPASSPKEGSMEATLGARDRSAPDPRLSMSSIELQGTRVLVPEPLVVPQDPRLTLGLFLLLILSLLGNAFQFYRHRLLGKTLGNELLSTFNSVSWSLGRCINKTRELGVRSTGEKMPDPVLFKEFRDFSLDSEFMLRTLREHLGTLARNLRSKDRRWETAPSVFPLEETEKMEEVLTESSESQKVQNLAVAAAKPRRKIPTG